MDFFMEYFLTTHDFDKMQKHKQILLTRKYFWKSRLRTKNDVPFEKANTFVASTFKIQAPDSPDRQHWFGGVLTTRHRPPQEASATPRRGRRARRRKARRSSSGKATAVTAARPAGRPPRTRLCFSLLHRRDIFHRHPHSHTGATRSTSTNPDCHLCLKKSEKWSIYPTFPFFQLPDQLTDGHTNKIFKFYFCQLVRWSR